tara:strand:- start:17077 stop:17442 length:366 start_codon:yes stop_codon:yes gene_type:complete
MQRIIKNQETIEDLLRLKKRIMKYWAANRDLPKFAIARKFGVGDHKLQYLLTANPPYPARYKQAAKRLKIPVEEVAKNYEAGKRWCSICCTWDKVENFGNYSAPSIRHRSVFCGGKKNGNK